MINVLVFPSGTEIGLEINRSLKFIKNINLVGVSTVPNHAKFVFDNYLEGLGTVEDTEFIKTLNEIILKENIDVVFPASDDVSEFLAQNIAELNCGVIGSNRETSEICRDKSLTYSFFKEYSFVPKTFNTLDIEKEKFPVFVKPKRGAGSVGAKKIVTQEELARYSVDEYVVSEYLPDEEYTVDCFTNNQGELLFSGIRERRRIKSGISVNSISLELTDEVKEIAETINNKLEFQGVWFFQLKKNLIGEYKLMEISTRVAGTMGLFRNKGINLPLLSVLDFLGDSVSIQENEFSIEIDRALENKYRLDIEYETILIDFDDTITLKNQVNPIVMMYLYQELNKNKKIVLVTRHAGNIQETLEKLKIDKSIFSTIHHIEECIMKSEIVNKYRKPIFIDDSFGERDDVRKKCGCPVFDVSAIECLLK